MYEQSFEMFGQLVKEFSESSLNLNEATTRHRLIDSIIAACGWEKNDYSLEEKNEEGYSDYTFYAPHRILIIEAKREGIHFELPISDRTTKCKLKYLCNTNENVEKAINQVIKYALSSGVEFCSITNGHQFIFFIGSRIDGINPLDGQAICFYSLGNILNNFILFWNLLSKNCVKNKYYANELLLRQKETIPGKLSTKIGGYPGNKARNVFQTDLQILSDFVIEDVRHNDEIKEEFYKECYCKSGALSQYALISKKILSTRYDSFFKNIQLTPVPATSKKGVNKEILDISATKRPILLIGDIGVGKTSFIQNLIRVDASNIFELCLTLYIDLGSKGTLAQDFKDFLLSEIASQFFDKFQIDISDNKFVRAVYNGELNKFKKGIYGPLINTNPTFYATKEIEFLEKLCSDLEAHLKRCCEHIVKTHGKIIVVIIDNADQRTELIQEDSFIISQEMAEHWPVTVFLALRPETFHRSEKIGVLSGYHPKVFTISPPRVDDVILKRLNFALKITSGEIPIQQQFSFKTKLENLEAIINAFLCTLDNSNSIIELLDNISYGNVRTALRHITDFFGSGHVDTQKIVTIYKSSGQYIIPLHEFLRALIFKDNEFYYPDRTEIANIFELIGYDSKSHFIVPLLIGYTADHRQIIQKEGFIDTNSIYTYLQSYGFLPDQIDKSIFFASNKNLIESNDKIISSSKPLSRSFRATPSGIYHIKILAHIFTYIDSMLVDTPILNEVVRDKVVISHEIAERFKSTLLFIDYLDECWFSVHGEKIGFDWTTNSISAKHEIAIIKDKLGF